MPKAKWNLNTIYISERLQESLRPISRCALTTVVAPMGYGKTTAVHWYLAERVKTEGARVIRISVYSDNLAIFWKSVQDAFVRAGFPFLAAYDCPCDAEDSALLTDDLCHTLSGDEICYIFIDDFHLLTDSRATAFLCTLTRRLPANVHLIVASRDRFLPAAEMVRFGGRVYRVGVEELRLNHMPSTPIGAAPRFPTARSMLCYMRARAGFPPSIFICARLPNRVRCRIPPPIFTACSPPR